VSDDFEARSTDSLVEELERLKERDALIDTWVEQDGERLMIDGVESPNPLAVYQGGVLAPQVKRLEDVILRRQWLTPEA
jgi:hypothetical protein